MMKCCKFYVLKFEKCANQRNIQMKKKLETLCLLRMQLIYPSLKIPIFQASKKFSLNAFNNNAVPNPKLHFYYSGFTTLRMIKVLTENLVVVFFKTCLFFFLLRPVFELYVLKLYELLNFTVFCII